MPKPKQATPKRSTSSPFRALDGSSTLPHRACSVRTRAEAGKLAFGTVDTWLVWQLTGGRKHLTDATNASRTLLYNIHEGAWDDELLRILETPRAVLPAVHSSSEVYAETEPDVFGAPLPIAGIAGDQQAALFGQMCAEESLAKSTYGTGAFVLLNTGVEVVPSENDLLMQFQHAVSRNIDPSLRFVGHVLTLAFGIPGVWYAYRHARAVQHIREMYRAEGEAQCRRKQRVEARNASKHAWERR